MDTDFTLSTHEPYKFTEIHIKLFNTGKLEIPGVLNQEILEKTKRNILSLLSHYYPNINFKHENVNSPDSISNVLINSNFNCGIQIDQNRLHGILKHKYKLISAFDPNSYPAIKTKFYFNKAIGLQHKELQNGRIQSEDDHLNLDHIYKSQKYTEITFMIFRTGSGLIMGKFSKQVLIFVYEYIMDILRQEFANIVLEINTSTVPTIVKKKKTKQIFKNARFDA